MELKQPSKDQYSANVNTGVYDQKEINSGAEAGSQAQVNVEEVDHSPIEAVAQAAAKENRKELWKGKTAWQN